MKRSIGPGGRGEKTSEPSSSPLPACNHLSIRMRTSCHITSRNGHLPGLCRADARSPPFALLHCCHIGFGQRDQLVFATIAHPPTPHPTPGHGSPSRQSVRQSVTVRSGQPSSPSTVLHGALSQPRLETQRHQRGYVRRIRAGGSCARADFGIYYRRGGGIDKPARPSRILLCMVPVVANARFRRTT